jgi:hypothetical protein
MSAIRLLRSVRVSVSISCDEPFLILADGTPRQAAVQRRQCPTLWKSYTTKRWTAR